VEVVMAAGAMVAEATVGAVSLAGDDIVVKIQVYHL